VPTVFPFFAKSLRTLLLFLLIFTGFAPAGRALVAPNITTDRIALLEKQVAEDKAEAVEAAAAAKVATANAQSTGDNAWVLTSSLLVLLMTGPGLALFYSGLVRKKNVLGTMMQSFAMMAVITLLWVVCGYSLAFAPGNAYIGGLSYAFLHGVGLTPNVAYAPTIPEQSFMIYQLMFAIITPALIAGAFAERMKFSAMMLFSVLWALLVYSPMAHMVWGVGGLLNASGSRPCLDFAGGTVVHITSGVSALVTAIYLGKRLGYARESPPPHSMVLCFIGACLLWVGWFGFNAGSALGAGPLATSAFVNTQFAAAAGAVSWGAVEWLRSGKASALGAISGAVAGLATVTQAAGFVQPISAVLIGLIAGAFCFFMVVKVKMWLGYDDSLDAFGVHGVGGTIGALLTGVFASSAVNPIFGKDATGHLKPTGLLEGNAVQFLHQLTAAAIGWGLAIVGTLVILFVVDKLIGLRVSEDEEVQGLDLSQHGEAGYDWDTSAT